MISKRAASLNPSLTISITMKAKELVASGENIITFGAGEPDFDTPEYITKAAKKAIDEGKTRYTPSSGTIELRKAIAKNIFQTRGVEYTPAQILVTAGAKQAIANVVLTLVDDGDEAIIPAPYWVSYPEMVKLAGGKCVYIETSESEDFLIEPDKLASAITPRTKILILNTPGNPTGSIYTKERLEEIYSVIKGKNITVISDEIYERLVYGGRKHFSPLSIDTNAAENTVLISGVSKSYAMTGWRIGFAAASEKIIKPAIRIQEHTTSSASSISQAAALAAYENEDSSVEKMREAFDERRKLMHSMLSSMNGIKCPEPHGAFYAFPNVSAYYGKTFNGKKVTNSLEFCEVLLEEAKVAVIPGLAFGADQNIRFSYAMGTEEIREGLDRFKKFLGSAK